MTKKQKSTCRYLSKKGTPQTCNALAFMHDKTVRQQLCISPSEDSEGATGGGACTKFGTSGGWRAVLRCSIECKLRKYVRCRCDGRNVILRSLYCKPCIIVQIPRLDRDIKPHAHGAIQFFTLASGFIFRIPFTLQ